MTMRPLLILLTVFSLTLLSAAETPVGLKLDPEQTYSVRLVLEGQIRLLNIGEIQVFKGERNLALEGQATMASPNANHPASNLIDGNTSGKASEPGGLAHSYWQVEPWAKIQLPSTDSIDKIVVWNRFPEGEDCTTRLLPFKLQLLDKYLNVVWETLIRSARIQTLTEAKAGDNRFQKIEVPVTSEGARELSVEKSGAWPLAFGVTPVQNLPVELLPQVGIIFSNWSKGVSRTEFDPALRALGWKSQAALNTDGEAMAKLLKTVDLVIFSTAANFNNPVDFETQASNWQAFFARGGSLLVTDANYDSVVDKLTGSWEQGFQAKLGDCAPVTGENGGSRVIMADPQHPLLQSPYDLVPSFQRRLSIWKHLEPQGDRWQNLVACADGKSLYLTQKIGNGVIVMTSYADFRNLPEMELCKGLLSNLWSYACALRSEVQLESCESISPVQRGVNSLSLRLTNRSSKAKSIKVVTAQKLLNGQTGPALMKRFTLPSEQTGFSINIPYIAEERGPSSVILVIQESGQTIASLEIPVQVPPPIMVGLDRDRYTMEQAKDVVCSIRIAAEYLTNVQKPKLKVCFNSKQKPSVVVALVEPISATMPCPLPKELSIGKYTVTAQLLNGDIKQALTESAPQNLHLDPEPLVACDAQGAFVAQGKPFFPVGLYHVSWSLPKENLLECIEDMKTSGFNLIHASYKKEFWQEFLDQAQKAGIMVIAEGANEEAMLKYADHPATFGWNVVDEPDLARMPPLEVKTRATRIKNLDPRHPNYVTLALPGSFSAYADNADILCFDLYPISPQLTTLSVVYEGNRQLREQLDLQSPRRALMSAIQAHEYPNLCKLPTPAQLRNMTYQALIAGSRGVIYFAYDMIDKRTRCRIKDYPELWEELKKMPAEIKEIETFLMKGNLTHPETSVPNVCAGVWTLADGRRLLGVANMSNQPTMVSLSNLPLGHFIPVKRNRQDALIQSVSGEFVGSMEPLEIFFALSDSIIDN